MDYEFSGINEYLFSQTDILEHNRAYKCEGFDSHIINVSGKNIMAPWQVVLFITVKMAACCNRLHRPAEFTQISEEISPF